MNRESGFTLIEIISVMLIAGIMATIAGFGIVTFAKGYQFTKLNTQMAQKARLTMARLSIELMEVRHIEDENFSTDAFIIYDDVTGRHAIARSSTEIQLFDLADDATSITGSGDTLIDSILDSNEGFVLNFYKDSGAWDAGSDSIKDLDEIEITFVMTRSDGGDNRTFTTRICPRNR